MTTIMEWRTSSGVQGRCDEKCHSATKPACDCMCGGVFHGSKRDGTFENKLENEGRKMMENLVAEGLIEPVAPSLPGF